MRRLLVATLMLGLFGPALSAGAAPKRPTGTLTIKAPRHASLAVTLHTSATLWLADDGDVDGPIFTGGGKHAGFLLLPASKRADTVGMVRIPATPYTSVDLLAGDDATPTIPAGRYTLEVVADQAVEIRVRLRGMSSRTWKATGPLAVRTATGSFPNDVGREVIGDGKFTLSATSAVFSVAMFRVTGVTVSAEWCVARTVHCGGTSTVQEARSTSTQPRVEQTAGASFYLAPREVRAGAWTSQWTVGADVLVREPTAYALIIG